MATRLQGTYYSTIHGHQFDIDIDDSDFGGSAIDFTVLDLNFHWHGVNEQRFNPIMTSSVDIVINVDSGSINSFVDDLVGAEEERFTIKIEKNSSLYWVGVVLVDEIRKQDRPYNSGYSFTLSATDGIGRLKDIDYNNAGTAYSGRETVMEHLFNVLGKIGLDSYWGASDIYVTSVIDWWEDSHTFSINTDPWTVTRFDHRIFIQLDQNGNASYLSAFEVLEMICTQWGLRFFHSGGRYYLIQVNEYANTGTVYLRHFVKAGTFDSVGSVASFSNTDKTWGNADDYGNGSADLVGLAPAEFFYFPPLDHVTIDYKHFSLQNLARDAAWNSESSATYSLANVDSNAGAARAAIRFYLTHSLDYNTNSFMISFMKFRFKVYIDDGSTVYYLKRVVNSPFVSTTVEWTTTDSNYEFYTNVQAEDNLTQYLQFSIVTPDLPQDGDMSLKLTYYQAYDLNNQLINSFDYTESWIARNFYLEILVDGTLEGQSSTTRYRVNNTDATTNSAKVELEFLMGDGPTGNAIGHYEVYDGADWSNSSAWRKSNSGTYDFKINELLAREILSGQITPVLKWAGTVRGDIEIYSTLVRDSLNLIALGVKYSGRTDEWEGEWFQISTNPTPIDVAEEEEWVQTPENPSGGENTPPPDPPYVAPSQDVSVAPSGPGPGDPGISTPTFPDIFVAQEDQTIDEGDNVTDFEIIGGNEDEIFFGDDSVILINPVTGEQQLVVINPTVDHATGDTTVNIVETVANYNFPEGSYIIANPVEQQANIQWGRRKLLNFHLIDHDADLPTSTSYTNYGVFFRPYSAPASPAGYQLEGKKYIRRVYWECASNPSGSALVSYTLDLVRGSSPTTVVSVTMNGQATEATAVPSGGEELLQDDYYWFRVKQNSASGLSMNTGLHVVLEIVNKAFTPDDIDGLTVWLRSDADVFSDAGTTPCTPGDTVQEWHDQTTNNNDASQSTASNKPTWETGGQNGWPYINFDGLNDRLDIGSTSTFVFLHETGGTIFVVAQYGETDDTDDIYSVIANTNNVQTDVGFAVVYDDQDSSHYENRVNTYVVNGTGGQQVVSNVSDNNAALPNFCNINIIVLDPDNGTAADRSDTYINGGSAISNNADTDTASSANATRTAQIGSNGSGGNPLAGRIYEILIYDTVLSDANRNRVYRYLDRKYRVNNATQFNPQQIAGLQLWLKADKGAYNDGGTTLCTDGQTVQEWHDWSGNDVDATQTTGASKPIWNDDALNGYPVITFDGIDDFLDAGNGNWFTGTLDFTIFVVGSASTGDFLAHHTGTTDDRSFLFRHDRVTTNSNGTITPGNKVLSFTTDYTGGYQIGAIVNDSGSAEFFVNGSSDNTGTLDTSLHNSVESFLIGANNSGANGLLNGSVAEIIIYTAVLTSSQRGSVERYLSSKYGITLL